ncbi:EscU/YscU/HrcU family type III secretion system export apparatus switch protein [Mitsuaria sp. GD03876]|uniref:EscU/YscU/HrcU family type III secretion system export apparatus switch protein n=1 Tax=Mitsuaria sp. GD03876 TaxID=2975399 RepID=UPI002449B87E|nr:EscU/YscU/HrcU family type III secretion system export apparatus switch protein [Mitsuaria sp. GD03876]MDH0865330.1 EscU/YscU/HrcU family type III secretion system export apparatus switch protein [Mitsuaria sp. GD03876]
MSEKNLPPTESRKRQAREDGQVGVSQDSLKILRLLLMAELAFATEPLWRGMVDALLEAALRQTAQPGGIGLAMSWESFLPVLVALLVLAVLPALVAVIGTLAQTRFNIAGKALGKGVDKLNPGANLKNLVSGQKLMMAVLGPVRSLLLLSVAWMKLHAELPNVAQAFRVDPAQGWTLSLAMLQGVERHCIVVLVLLIVTDILLQRYLVFRQLRMDISEVRRDYKQNEGDPMLKGTRKQFAKEIAMSDSPPARQRPSAVVVNPEHVAVSLYYDPEETEVPLILDKRTDEEALALRRKAREDGVPVVRYVGLARRLLETGEVGKPVPDPSFRAIALLLRVIEVYEQQAPELLRPTLRPGEDESRLDLASVDDEIGQQMLDLA